MIARRAFAQLARNDLKDAVRDPQIGVSMLTMMLVLLAIHSCMWLAFTVSGEAPRVHLGDGLRSETRAQLRGFEAAEAGEIAETAEPAKIAKAANVRVEPRGEGGAVISVLEPGVGWDPVWQAVRESGVPAREITVLGRDGEAMPDFLRMNLGTTLLAVLASVAFLGTTVPVVQARERGMLRLLGMTPLPRWLFLLSKVPARALLIVIATLGIATIAILRRYAEPAALPSLALTVCCGSIAVFGAAALFAARSSNAEATQQGMVFVSLLLVFSSGAVLPAAILPEPMRVTMGFLPGSWFAEAAASDLAGLDPLLPLPVSWALLLLFGAVCFAAAGRRFSWDGTATRAEATNRAVTRDGRTSR